MAVERAPTRVIVVGGSAGALDALIAIAESLFAELPAAVLAVIHMNPAAESRLPDLLSRGPLPARHPRHGETPPPGTILVARPDQHMVIEDQRVMLGHGARVNGHRPAIDPLFRSAAHEYGPQVAGVILSGNLDDGSVGLLMVRDRGGLTLVQDPEEARFPDMPRNAIAVARPHRVLPARDLGGALREWVSAGGHEMEPRPGPPIAQAAPPAQGAVPPVPGSTDAQGTPSGFSCPDCGGVLWYAPSDGAEWFRCRVGHEYSPAALFQAQNEGLESALWAAVRALRERASTARMMAGWAERQGRAKAGASFADRARRAEADAAYIEAALLREEL
jgi:two-component system chemotaxis response regulator CheB